MKTAIYIEDGTVQLVITPESEFEKNALICFEKKPLNTKIFSGAFYDCRGGWVRQSAFMKNGIYECDDPNDKSLIIKVSEDHPS